MMLCCYAQEKAKVSQSKVDKRQGRNKARRLTKSHATYKLYLQDLTANFNAETPSRSDGRAQVAAARKRVRSEALRITANDE